MAKDPRLPPVREADELSSKMAHAPRFVDEQPLVGVAGGPAVSRAYVGADNHRYAVLCNAQQMVLTDFRRNTVVPSPRTPGMSASTDCDGFVQSYVANAAARDRAAAERRRSS
jgi:hypothetical protein